MTQTWDPAAYGQNGAFVHGLAGGVLEWLAAEPGERILDLGCGDGQLTKRIANTGALVRGVDASPQMVKAAQARGVAAEEASAEALPYPDGLFDAEGRLGRRDGQIVGRPRRAFEELEIRRAHV